MNFAFHPSSRAAAWTTIIVVIILVAAIPGLLKTSIDNRIERWADPRGESAQRYSAFQERFGNDEFALIAYAGADIFEEAALDVQLDVLERIESLPLVSQVVSVPSVYRDNFGAEDPDELQRDFLDTPFYHHFLISETGEMAAYFVLLSPVDRSDARTQLAGQLRDAAMPLHAHGFNVYHAGSPILNAAMDESSLREGRIVFPTAIAIAVGMLIILLRSWRGAAIAIVCTTLSTGATMGIAGHLNVSLNMMTSVLPALLWVLTLTNPIHLIRRFQDESATNMDPHRALVSAIESVALPCVLSSLTTAAGFVSLAAATLAPVREFGAFASIGFVSSLAVTFTVVPQLIRLVGAPRRPGRDFGVADRFFHGLQRLQHYPKTIIAVAVVFTVIASLCVPFIDFDSNPLTFFDEDTEIVDAYRHIGDGLTGLYSLELVIETPQGWLDSNAWVAFERIEDGMSVVPGVTRVLSPLDILKKANQWDHDFAPDAYVLPPTEEAATALVEELGPADREFIARQIADDGRTVRVTVLAHNMSNSGLFKILDIAEGIVLSLPGGFSGYTTGLVPHVVQSHEKLIETQIRTIAIAFVVVFVCILIGLRSWTLTIVSIPPNLLPVLAALCAMAWTHIRLDVATVMTASVALGIAVDDTVHMLTAYRTHRRAGLSDVESWHATLERVGPAILVTTLTACAAFATLSFSGFVPLRHFGQLAGLAIAVAFVADVLLLPALVLVLSTTFARTERD